MQKIGIFYGSSTGNTENGAKQIQEVLGADNAVTFDVSDASASDVEQFENIILGASTWGIGDMQDDFADFLPALESVNLEGKKIAIFGFGDQDSYSDSFVDAIGEIYETVQGSGAEVIGKVSTDGYEYDASKAEVDGQFVGLPLDDDNQDDLTKDRISAWVEAIKGQFN